MKETQITVGTEEELDYLGKQLFLFNRLSVPAFAERDAPSDTVRYIIKEDETLIAGIAGNMIIHNVLYIDVLFVAENHRNKGYARNLLQKMESEAKSRGCYLAYLDTINPAAIDFYEKHGYEVFATLENVPCPNVNAVYLKKAL